MSTETRQCLLSLSAKTRVSGFNITKPGFRVWNQWWSLADDWICKLAIRYCISSWYVQNGQKLFAKSSSPRPFRRLRSWSNNQPLYKSKFNRSLTVFLGPLDLGKTPGWDHKWWHSHKGIGNWYWRAWSFRWDSKPWCACVFFGNSIELVRNSDCF